MAIPDALCADPTLCCDRIVLDGLTVLTSVQTALYECLGYDPDADNCGEAPFVTFFGFGQPAMTLDYLTIWLEQITPDFNQDPRTTRFGQSLNVQWLIRLQLSGYPTFAMDGQTIVNPDPVVLNRVNQVMTAIGTVVLSTIQTGSPVGCSGLQIINYLPAIGGGDVLGGTAGVTVRFSYNWRP